MVYYWAWALKGTIFPRKKEKGKISFLDPWTSLLPDFLKKRLAPDILAIFTKSEIRVGTQVDLSQAKLPFWALVFPKRTYVPPDYPHLQLWFLSQRFAPSISFVDQNQRQLLGGILNHLEDIFFDWLRQHRNSTPATLAWAINATPFSFIKNPKTKEYYWGGQSVRTFHLHLLLLPQKLRKIDLAPDQAPLVYPTKFARELFRLVLTSRGFRRWVSQGSKLIEAKVVPRGVRLRLPLMKGESILERLSQIDQVFYHLQISLINAFYRDSGRFLTKLADFMAADCLKKLATERKELLLVGKERSLSQIRTRLRQELLNLNQKFSLNLSRTEIEALGRYLTLDQNGDLASWLDNQVVVLRPGMGYGTLIRRTKSYLDLYLVPLDSLLTEGTMESAGYFFIDKVRVAQKPTWPKTIVQQLGQSFG